MHQAIGRGDGTAVSQILAIRQQARRSGEARAAAWPMIVRPLPSPRAWTGPSEKPTR